MKQINQRFLIVLPALALILASLNCTVNLGGGDNNLSFTQTALALQQTSLALQNSGLNATVTAQQATLNAPAPVEVQPTIAPIDVSLPTPDLSGTMVALAIQQTALAGASAPTAVPPVQVEPPQPPAPVSEEAFETWMKTASILVFEDIVEDPGEYQYVKKTLQAMGLKSKWDGNALGWLKSDMLSSPNGKPWDLVIIAVEMRTDVSGEYFDYLNGILDKGSSVIVEAWHLDEISQGAISPILMHCGVEVYQYPTEGWDINDAIVWPLPGNDSPLLQQPNSGMRFTKVRDTWFYSFDLGSQMALTGQGDAQLLLGTDAQDATQDGTLATCMKGQFTLQTFSSHTFPYDVMYPLWENYIYNALKVRYSNMG